MLIQRDPEPWLSYANLKWGANGEIGVKFKKLLDGYRKMFDQSLSKSKDLGNILKLLPGVVVQSAIGMRGMADLYRIEPDLLDRVIKSPIELLKNGRVVNKSVLLLDEYLSGFLQDRGRSQLHYRDPILQHISICRHFMSLLNDGVYPGQTR